MSISLISLEDSGKLSKINESTYRVYVATFDVDGTTVQRNITNFSELTLQEHIDALIRGIEIENESSKVTEIDVQSVLN